MDKKRYIVLQKTNGKCGHCGKPIVGATVTFDHVTPKYYGGTLHQNNVIALCKDCNKAKGSSLVNIDKYYKFASKKAKIQAKFYAIDFFKDRGRFFNKKERSVISTYIKTLKKTI